jgi:hypothetical protein
MPAETSAGGWRGEYRARPSDPTTTAYCVDAVFEVPWTGAAAGNAGAGLFFTNATGVVYWYSGGGVLQFGRYSTATAFAGNDAEVAAVGSALFGLRIAEDATERHAYGLDLQTAATANELAGGFGRTVTITATSVGWVALGADADLARRVRLVHWATSSCTP